MVEARENTEAFDIGSTIWGTWVTDLNQLGSGYDLLYRTVECNRSLTSSEGAFEVSHETYVQTNTAWVDALYLKHAIILSMNQSATFCHTVENILMHVLSEKAQPHACTCIMHSQHTNT